MNPLCSPTELRTAIESCVLLLSKEELEARKVREEVREKALDLKEFLQEICGLCENADSVTELVKRLEHWSPRRESFYHYFSYLGKLLDAVQIAKSQKRRERIDSVLRELLKESGHAFLITDYRSLYDELIEEVNNATILYHMFYVIHSLHLDTNNPIAVFRNSMGNRTPEEYFSNLVVGWFLEDIFYEVVCSKGLEIEKQGVDALRKILFGRMQRMGRPDFLIKLDSRKESIELQRVGRGSIELESQEYLLLKIPEHKLRLVTLIVFWIGRDQMTTSNYEHLNNTLLFVPVLNQNPRERPSRRTVKIKIALEMVNQLGKRWEDLVSMSGSNFLEHIRTVLREDIRYTLVS